MWRACLFFERVTVPDILNWCVRRTEQSPSFALGAEHVGMFSITAPIDVHAVLAAGHVCSTRFPDLNNEDRDVLRGKDQSLTTGMRPREGTTR